jgi:hypothetical protein
VPNFIDLLNRLETEVYCNQRDAVFIQFTCIEKQESLHVSSITCSSSGFDILRAYNVSLP